jgi:DNA-binding transcriptional LysR family regulator
LSAAARQWPGWVCEPLWHDTLAVAVAKRSHLLAYREVPCQEVLKQPLICAQSTADEPWRMTVQRVFENALQEREQTVETFDVAMTLVAAGYGIAIAPAARLASYLRRGIAAAAGRRTNDRDGLPAPPQRFLVGHPGKIRPPRAGVLTDARGSRFRHDPAFRATRLHCCGDHSLSFTCAHRHDELVEIRHVTLSSAEPPRSIARGCSSAW